MALLEIVVRPEQAALSGDRRRPLHRVPSPGPTFGQPSIPPTETNPSMIQTGPGAEVPPGDGGEAQRATIQWTLAAGVPVGRALVSATQRLTEAGCDSPRLDAQLLLAHVLGQERSWLFAHHDHPLSPEEAQRYTELVARRARREPVAYLIGRKAFYGLEFVVDRRVLIPRPETELLVDLALDQLSRREGRPVAVADVGTGSGAIAVSLAVHAPWARIYGLDISAEALEVARENGRRLAQEDNPVFLQSDLLEALPQPVDLIVANLPYVTSQDYADLAPDILEYEPRLALEAGPEGLDLIRRLLDQAGDHLKSDGVILLEIGADQGEVVTELARQMEPRPSYIGVRRDYSGHVRTVTLEF